MDPAPSNETTTEETRREFLKKSGRIAAGLAVALPLVTTLSPSKARAGGSCGPRFGRHD